MSRSLNFFNQVRNYASKPWKKDCVVYGQVKYYPRFPDEKDPPITPTKLLMVRRVKPFKGNPWWDKRILASLKLTETTSEIQIVKNTPENCLELWKIKHLIKVTPINLPDELPEDDSKYAFLHENGDLLLAPRVDPAREEATLKHINNPKRLDRVTLKRELRMRWLMPYDT